MESRSMTTEEKREAIFEETYRCFIKKIGEYYRRNINMIQNEVYGIFRDVDGYLANANLFGTKTMFTFGRWETEEILIPYKFLGNVENYRAKEKRYNEIVRMECDAYSLREYIDLDRILEDLKKQQQINAVRIGGVFYFL